MDLPLEMWNLSLPLWILNSLSFPINKTLSIYFWLAIGWLLLGCIPSIELCPNVAHFAKEKGVLEG